MLYFDKSITFKNLQGPPTDYHLRIYKTRDEDNMNMIELGDEANLKFIYRLRLTPKSIDKICRENGISRDNFNLKYIQEFVSELSENQWLTCELSGDNKECNICFYVKKIGCNCILKLKLMYVSYRELIDYVIDKAEKYKKDAEEYMILKIKYEKLKKENEKTEKEADQLVRKKEQLEDGIKVLKNKCNNLKEAVKEIADKGRRHEAKIIKYAQDNEELQKRLTQYENSYKILKAENTVLLKESSNKDNQIADLTTQVQNLTNAKELSDRMIVELKLNQKSPSGAATEACVYRPEKMALRKT